MAVFTELSEGDCAEIAAAFRLGRLTSVIGIADGNAETTFLFRSERGEFIVTLFETGAEPFELERAFRTMEALAAAGVPCPATCRTDGGAATITVSGKLAAVVGFVPGSSPSEVTPGRCRALGACAARIHSVLARGGGNGRLLLPKGAVHGALTRDNVFFIGETVSGIINFRLRHDDVLVAELAQLLVAWSMRADGMLAENLAQALLEGYERVRPLSDAERRCLPAFVMAATATSLAEADRLAEVEENVLRTSISMRALLDGIGV
jgi:homoserine kinase type II